MTPKFRAWTEEGEVMYYDVYPFKDDTLLLSYDEIAMKCQQAISSSCSQRDLKTFMAKRFMRETS